MIAPSIRTIILGGKWAFEMSTPNQQGAFGEALGMTLWYILLIVKVFCMIVGIATY